MDACDISTALGEAIRDAVTDGVFDVVGVWVQDTNTVEE